MSYASAARSYTWRAPYERRRWRSVEARHAAVRGTSFVFDGYSLQVRQGRVQLLNRAGRWVTVGDGERSRSDGIADATKPIREVERRVVTTPYIPGPEPRVRGAERIVRTSSTGSIVIESSIADPPDFAP